MGIRLPPGQVMQLGGTMIHKGRCLML